MIITKRIETFYKVEMTAEQAHLIHRFLNAMQERHIEEIAKMAGDTNGTAIEETREALTDFQATLEGR